MKRCSSANVFATPDQITGLVYSTHDQTSRSTVPPGIQLFRAVNVKFSIEGRWMRRRDDPSTYMEVYEGVTDGKAFESFLEREGARLGVPRKVECFISSETLA